MSERTLLKDTLKWLAPPTLVAVVLMTAATVINSWMASVGTPERRVHPTVAGLDDLAVGLALLTLLWLVARLFRQARPALSNRPVWLRWALYLSMLAVHIGVLVGGLKTTFDADPHFMDDQLTDTLEAPDGQATAYLYRDWMFCSWSVFERPTGEVMMDRVEVVPRNECEDAHLEWKDGRPIVMGGDDQPMEKQYWSLSRMLGL